MGSLQNTTKKLIACDHIPFSLLTFLLAQQSYNSVEGCNQKDFQWLSFCKHHSPSLVDKECHCSTWPTIRVRNVSMWVHLFGLINKATWPKSFTFGIKINCHAYLKILGLPASILCKKNPQVESIKMEANSNNDKDKVSK